jgi:hypothetical protein
MTNKSIRDYINLIENAQREGVAEGSEDSSYNEYLKKYANAKKPLMTRSEFAYIQKRRAEEKARSKNSKQGVSEGTVYPNAQVIKSKNGKPVGEIYQDGNTWGCFHYRADRGADFLDSREDAIQELKLIHQENGRKTPDYTIKGEVDEEQLEETSPEAIAKINQITRR